MHRLGDGHTSATCDLTFIGTVDWPLLSLSNATTRPRAAPSNEGEGVNGTESYTRSYNLSGATLEQVVLGGLSQITAWCALHIVHMLPNCPAGSNACTCA